MLLSACQQGAELDVSLALVKCTAKPGVSLVECFEAVCASVGIEPCEGCGGLHVAESGLSEAAIWELAEDDFCCVVMQNEVRLRRFAHNRPCAIATVVGECPTALRLGTQGHNAHKKLMWQGIKARRLETTEPPRWLH